MSSCCWERAQKRDLNLDPLVDSLEDGGKSNLPDLTAGGFPLGDLAWDRVCTTKLATHVETVNDPMVAGPAALRPKDPADSSPMLPF